MYFSAKKFFNAAFRHFPIIILFMIYVMIIYDMFINMHLVNVTNSYTVYRFLLKLDYKFPKSSFILLIFSHGYKFIPEI
jgi:hypothetical protein